MMYAAREIHGKIGKRAFVILEGREIPEAYMGHLDIERLKKAGAIVDPKKVAKVEKDDSGK